MTRPRSAKNEKRRLQAALRKEPRSHWLLTRLASAYYEERQYARAAALSGRALALRDLGENRAAVRDLRHFLRLARTHRGSIYGVRAAKNVLREWEGES